MSEIRLTEAERDVLSKMLWDTTLDELAEVVEAILARRLMAVGELAQEPMWGWPMFQTYWRKMSEIRWATGTETPTDVHNRAALAPPARPDAAVVAGGEG